MFSVEESRELLKAAGVFFGCYDEDTDDPKWEQTLNLNDAMCWACSDLEYVPDEQLPEVASLFWRYGWCGILYWVSETRGGGRAEFTDVNRFVEFVRNEEAIRKEVPESSKRAYAKRGYVITGEQLPADREEALSALAAEAQELGMYDTPPACEPGRKQDDQ